MLYGDIVASTLRKPSDSAALANGKAWQEGHSVCGSSAWCVISRKVILNHSV